MKKSFVKTVCGIVLAGAMLAATGCGNTSSSASANNSTTVVEESTGEQFEATSLEANQVMILGKVLDIPFNYSKISKQLSLREEMTEKFNVKVPARGTLGNVFLDVAGYEGSYVEVTLHSGITIGSSAYQITGQYGDPDKTIDEKTGFQYVYEVGDVTYTFAFDTDKDGLQAIEIVYSGN